MAMACSAGASAATIEDEIVRKFIADVNSGADFKSAQYAVKIDERSAQLLKARQSCQLAKKGTLSGGVWVMVDWSCPGVDVSKAPGAMLKVEKGKLSEISVPEFVPPPGGGKF